MRLETASPVPLTDALKSQKSEGDPRIRLRPSLTSIQAHPVLFTTPALRRSRFQHGRKGQSERALRRERSTQSDLGVSACTSGGPSVMISL